MPIEWSGLAPRRTADSSTPDLFRSRNPSLPRGSLSLSMSLIDAGLVDRVSLILHPSLAGGSGAATRSPATPAHQLPSMPVKPREWECLRSSTRLPGWTSGELGIGL